MSPPGLPRMATKPDADDYDAAIVSAATGLHVSRVGSGPKRRRTVVHRQVVTASGSCDACPVRRDRRPDECPRVAGSRVAVTAVRATRIVAA